MYITFRVSILQTVQLQSFFSTQESENNEPKQTEDRQLRQQKCVRITQFFMVCKISMNYFAQEFGPCKKKKDWSPKF